jgi:hypothetical protein
MSQPDAASRAAMPAPMPMVRPTPVTSATGLPGPEELSMVMVKES